jgi:hypothetical protein
MSSASSLPALRLAVVARLDVVGSRNPCPHGFAHSWAGQSPMRIPPKFKQTDPVGQSALVTQVLFPSQRIKFPCRSRRDPWPRSHSRDRTPGTRARAGKRARAITETCPVPTTLARRSEGSIGAGAAAVARQPAILLTAPVSDAGAASALHVAPALGVGGLAAASVSRRPPRLRTEPESTE